MIDFTFCFRFMETFKQTLICADISNAMSKPKCFKIMTVSENPAIFYVVK